jgi:hypothetical protein
MGFYSQVIFPRLCDLLLNRPFVAKHRKQLLATRRVKLLRPTANAQADEVCGSLAIGPFMRLTARLPGPKLCLSPQPHRVRHELRPPALATPARRPGGGRHPGRRITPSLHPRGVGWQEGIAEPGVTPGTGSLRAT